MERLLRTSEERFVESMLPGVRRVLREVATTGGDTDAAEVRPALGTG